LFSVEPYCVFGRTICGRTSSGIPYLNGPGWPRRRDHRRGCRMRTPLTVCSLRGEALRSVLPRAPRAESLSAKSQGSKSDGSMRSTELHAPMRVWPPRPRPSIQGRTALDRSREPAGRRTSSQYPLDLTFRGGFASITRTPPLREGWGLTFFEINSIPLTKNPSSFFRNSRGYVPFAMPTNSSKIIDYTLDSGR